MKPIPPNPNSNGASIDNPVKIENTGNNVPVTTTSNGNSSLQYGGNRSSLLTALNKSNVCDKIHFFFLVVLFTCYLQTTAFGKGKGDPAPTTVPITEKKLSEKLAGARASKIPPDSKNKGMHSFISNYILEYQYMLTHI